MTNIDDIREALLARQPMFFPDTDQSFRKQFVQRWYGDLRKRNKIRTHAQAGTYKDQAGTFVWTEGEK